MLTITGGQEAPDIPEGHMQTAILCKRQGCPNTLTRIPKFRKREYCSDICKQIAYRERKAQLISNTRQLQDRIRELEERVQVLEARPKLEERVRADTTVQHFKTYLRRHPQPRDTDFFTRFLADIRLPQHASRALYEAKLKTYGYQTEDIHLFHDAWLTMLLEQSSRDDL